MYKWWMVYSSWNQASSGIKKNGSSHPWGNQRENLEERNLKLVTNPAGHCRDITFQRFGPTWGIFKKSKPSSLAPGNCPTSHTWNVLQWCPQKIHVSWVLHEFLTRQPYRWWITPLVLGDFLCCVHQNGRIWGTSFPVPILDTLQKIIFLAGE